MSDPKSPNERTIVLSGRRTHTKKVCTPREAGIGIYALDKAESTLSSLPKTENGWLSRLAEELKVAEAFNTARVFLASLVAGYAEEAASGKNEEIATLKDALVGASSDDTDRLNREISRVQKDRDTIVSQIDAGKVLTRLAQSIEEVRSQTLNLIASENEVEEQGDDGEDVNDAPPAEQDTSEHEETETETSGTETVKLSAQELYDKHTKAELAAMVNDGNVSGSKMDIAERVAAQS